MSEDNIDFFRLAYMKHINVVAMYFNRYNGFNDTSSFQRFLFFCLDIIKN